MCSVSAFENFRFLKELVRKLAQCITEVTFIASNFWYKLSLHAFLFGDVKHASTVYICSNFHFSKLIFSAFLRAISYAAHLLAYVQILRDRMVYIHFICTS